VKFHPNQDPHILEWYIDHGYRGFVLEGTGLGHIGNYFFSSIRKAIENEMIVAMTSQCIWGRLGMNVYNQGRDLLAMGVLPLEDMLPETALVKLMWALGQTTDIDDAKTLLTQNIANEVSARTLYE
jgi:glutamyl-tRNA(Gln) amidotransferase subunit D